MISKETLDYLKTLDRLRITARTLRDQGLEGILGFDLDDDHWEQQISNNEKVLFRRAKHLAWSLGKIEEHDCEYGEHLFYPPDAGKNRPYNSEVNYPDWPAIKLPLYKVTDLVDPIGLYHKFKDARIAGDPLSRYVLDLFKLNRVPFDKYEGGEPNDALLKCLVKILNGALTEPALYKQVKRDRVKIPQEAERLIAEELTGAGVLRLNRILLDDIYKDEVKPAEESVELFHLPGEPAPILFAANFLRTRLGNLHLFLEVDTLSCYYRIVRELYNLHNTNWGFGAARPGEHSGKPSVFVTTECARAIGYFARLSENTSHFLQQMHAIKQYVDHVETAQHPTDPFVPKLPVEWCQGELECCFVSLKTTIEGFRDYVAITLPDLKEASDLRETIKLVEESVAEFVERSVKSFEDVEQWVRTLRQVEQKFRERSKRPRKKKTKLAILEQMPEFDLTETAHRVALGAIAGARKEFERLNEKTSDQNILTESAAVFMTLAKWLRTHLGPAKEYFERVLHKCLAENARERSPKMVHDLALSALSVGLITKDWNRHDCRQALEILCENVDEGGEFPEGSPFAYTAKGEGRTVINAQIIRAFAQIAQHVPEDPDPEVFQKIPARVERMIDYFESRVINHKRGVAWPGRASLHDERSSLWITSISVLALHRIVLMLDELINNQVKKHLNTKTPADLKRDGVPYLHRLMCSDIGYTALDEGEHPDDRRALMELEGMRAHLLGSARVRKALRARTVLDDLPLRSLILDGPPGTGKTTLVKSLAVTSNVDFVEVMSHDLYRPGTEHVMEQATMVMDALAMLTGTVILFDEFEPILHVRPDHPVRITEMLTGNMLPKFDALYKAAGQNRIAYVMATNHVERLDSAAIRAGRFDRMRFIYYPDPASRACRLASEFRLLLKRLEEKGLPLPQDLKGADRRLTTVVAMTARCYINRLCNTGWFSAPEIKTASKIDQKEIVISPQTEDRLRPVWRYILSGEESELIDWTLFGSAERTSAEAAPVDGEKKPKVERPVEKLVKQRDEGLYNSVKANPDYSWDEMIALLIKPFRARRVGVVRPFTGDKRWSEPIAS
jgi:hypothetical protein